ncbi:MAG: 4-hydroxy-tetrahydrodipicolinate reductase [Muribaculaceae bacterium]|nr:4-hydroxy-tetrahydrodipicolinate reductase [Muribaculaceae bacterium]
MKIALIGYGRMGHLLEEVIKSRGLEVSCIIDVDDQEKFLSEAFCKSDVAIEFSTPASAVDGILRCFAAGVPVVVGTTGWDNSMPEIKAICDKGKGTLLYSSNFSIGMNIFMAMNRYVTRIMNGFDTYTPALSEVHHVHKLDHPSGTAVTLANELTSISSRFKKWIEKEEGQKAESGLLPVYHKREGEVPGIHTITWESEVDSIIMTHDAKNRLGFARGAVSAAQWLAGKKGFFTIGDFLSDVTGTGGIFNSNEIVS